ncbi:MAG: peptidase [Alphaproteobacteria bacterium]|nr:peptidase [Alphaproteobacteria bacterium]
MTYCVGMLLRSGLVMVSDTRTNAGVDHIASFRKMTVWEEPGERVVVLTASGNLALTQSVVNYLEEGVPGADGEAGQTMRDVESMFKAAQLVGQAIQAVYRVHGPALEAKDPGAFNVSFLLGGQIRGRRLRLFQIYSAGNFIEATEQTCFLQIGETKYGKPILDRALTFDTDLRQAAKLALISMDSTLRSNLSVGPPIDLVIYPIDTLRVDVRKCLDEQDGYFRNIRQLWSQSLREAFQRLPDPDW